MIALIVLLFIAYWILAGLIAFFIEAKMEGVTQFGDEEKEEFKTSILLGFVSLIIIVGIYSTKKIRVNMSKIIERILIKMNGSSMNN